MVDGRWWRVIAVAAAVGMVVALPIGLREPAAKAAPVETEEPASVRVEHEFVTLDAEVSDAQPAVVLPAGPTARPLRQPQPSPILTGHESAPASTFTKARRTFLGDGRHRPEPFPRVR